MWTELKNKKKLVLYGAFFLLLAYCLVVKVVAASKLDYYTDEPDDVANALSDKQTFHNFFKDTTSPDQARLPHIISMPILAIAGENSLLPSRILFILIHLLYLVVLYKLFRLSLSKTKAFFALSLTAFSAYLFSFSTFTMTTSSNLFLLLGTLLMYYYLRYFKPRSNTFLENHIYLLGVIAGLAMASRFFSAVILIALFLYDGWFNRNKLITKDTLYFWKLPIEKINIFFTIGWIIINFLPITAPVKIFAFALLIVYYVGNFILDFRTNKSKKTTIGFLGRWIVVVHTAFVVTLIASPIHLNVYNVIRIFDWSKTWHEPLNYINPSRYDILTIIGVKMGWLIGLSLVIAMAIIALRRQLKSFLTTYALYIIIIALHLALFLQVRFVIVWYPLFMMPFLYIPFAYIFPDTVNEIKKPATALLAVALISVPIYEQYRYWNLFPYGQIDGAQYGADYIGWNKPGAISFEASHQIIDYIAANEAKSPPGIIICKLVDNQHYNPYAAAVFNNALQMKGLNNFVCSAETTGYTAPYVLTSLYIPDSDIHEIQKHYKEDKVFYETSVPIATLWVHR